METTILFSYTEEIIPPRCRKPRPVRFHDGELKHTIPEVTAAEAPVAIVAELPTNKYGVSKLEYRFYDGSLWVPVRMGDTMPTGFFVGDTNCKLPVFPAAVDLKEELVYATNHELGLSYYASKSKQEIKQKLLSKLKANLIIDGAPYRRASEPRYVVVTFGLGQNHGGTACMVDTRYNPNISKDAYFSLLDKEKALVLATEIATQRGDTKSLPMEVNGPVYRVLMNEAIQVKPIEQHGDGDPFLNQLQGMTIAAEGSPVIGLAILASTLAR